ncbi:MAG: Rieske 2Fe-2S domain-containing protein [Deltaproteobacteria bacterium]|nr:Rieske 2Fe-2S domain-containing protein [Deltaproteobacteria bacterium]MBI2364164.1 Rieske 2Fe-2S domain-containing protein [Deltaproteobacteria bacterium]
MNKIEEYKKEKDGLEILHDLPRYATEGWEAITDGDKERLKWAGVFFRRQTPGHFMMRVRIPNGITTATQVRALGEISEEFGKGFADITTRQQIQLRWFTINDVPEIWRRMESVGLISLQTGMDNIRGVIGCPAAGLTPNELFDASPVVREFTRMFVGNRAYTNLPRKFNVTITACKEACTHAEAQDIALTPATKEVEGVEVKGFNVAVGGKLGSGGFRIASPLDLFVTPEEAAAICSHIVMIFRDHGARESRTKARLAFLIESWGVEKFRGELERQVDRPLSLAGRDARAPKHTDHVGVFRQKQGGLNYVGLAVPVGRITGEQMIKLAEIAENYGNGQIRITVGQNLIIPNVPDKLIGELTSEPMLQELRYDPSEVMRGLVSCTGMDYCHFALIETKERALKTARVLEEKLGKTQPLRMHWSGCPAGCGNHSVADIGLLGKNIKVNGEVVEAVDVFAGGAAGCEPNFPVKIMEDVPCEALPQVIAGFVQYGAFKAMRQQLRKIPQAPANGVKPPVESEPAKVLIRPQEIQEGSAKLVRVRNEEVAVFKHQGRLCALQNNCPHEGGQLAMGWLEGGEVVCPLHGYKFDLKTGACSTDPKLNAKTFRLVADGDGFAVEKGK